MLTSNNYLGNFVNKLILKKEKTKVNLKTMAFGVV